MKILAVIPARGGSKRVPNKNIIEIAGQPLIAYTIKQAQLSTKINRIIVSTDREEIAQVAKQYGAEVPFMRPSELAQDDTPDLPVFQHALNYLKESENYYPDVIVVLRPTSPLREVSDVDNAIDLLINNPQADSVRTVIEPNASPYKMYQVDDQGLLKPFVQLEGLSEGYNLPDQKLPKVYRHIGTADVVWPKTILEKNSMSGYKIMPLIIERAYSGLNTKDDLEFYRVMLESRKK